MASHNDLGRSAENRAAELLRRSGWRIIARNWRFGHKEIDLVARRGTIVAFVEVRARRSTTWGHPLETIGWRKRRDLATAARAWVAAHGRPGETYRFDVVVLVGTAGDASDGSSGWNRPEHIEDAWRL